MTKQSMEALETANAMREARRELKEELRWREVPLLDALMKPCIQTMEVRKLLEALPRIGPYKAAKLVARLNLSPATQVQNLSQSRRRQLEELVG